MSQDSDPSLAKVKAHPAIIVTLGVAGVFHFRNLWTIKTDSNPLAVDVIALLFIVAGIVILVLAYFCMFKAQTTINPKMNTTRKVAVGIKNLSFSSFLIALAMLTLYIGQ